MYPRCARPTVCKRFSLLSNIFLGEECERKFVMFIHFCSRRSQKRVTFPDWWTNAVLMCPSGVQNSVGHGAAQRLETCAFTFLVSEKSEKSSSIFRSFLHRVSLKLVISFNCRVWIILYATSMCVRILYSVASRVLHLHFWSRRKVLITEQKINDFLGARHWKSRLILPRWWTQAMFSCSSGVLSSVGHCSAQSFARCLLVLKIHSEKGQKCAFCMRFFNAKSELLFRGNIFPLISLLMRCTSPPRVCDPNLSFLAC